MDSTIDEFTRKVLDFRHTSLTSHEMVRVAQHLREIVMPQLAERETLLAENAALKQQAVAKKKAAA